MHTLIYNIVPAARNQQNAWRKNWLPRSDYELLFYGLYNPLLRRLTFVAHPPPHPLLFCLKGGSFFCLLCILLVYMLYAFSPQPPFVPPWCFDTNVWNLYVMTVTGICSVHVSDTRVSGLVERMPCCNSRNQKTTAKTTKCLSRLQHWNHDWIKCHWQVRV